MNRLSLNTPRRPVRPELGLRGLVIIVYFGVTEHRAGKSRRFHFEDVTT